MVAFYNAADQELYKKYQYLPQEKYRLGLNLPTNTPVAPPPISGGITNTNAFANSGGNDNFNPAGNAFGEGTAVNPVYGNTYIDTVRREGVDSLPAYERLIDAGGTAPAGMFQTDYFPGTENELADAMGRMPGQEGYAPNMDYSEDAFQKADDKRGFLSRLMNNAKQSMTNLPSWAQTAITAAGLVNPFTAIPKLIGMGGGDGGPSYGIAGLSDAKKGSYDALASGDMLFNTTGGFKTLTGKNFQAKNYIPNQLEIYNKLKDIKEDELTSFQKLQLKESSAIFKDNEKFYNNQNINAGNDPTNTYDYGITQGVSNADYTGGGSLQTAIDNARDRSDRQDEGKGPAGSSTYNDPYDPGGGEKDGGFIDGTNRRQFNKGGRIKFNMGGAQFAAANEGEDISPGTDSGGNFRGSDNDNNNNDNNNDNNNQVITNPVDISTVTKSIGDYEIPYGLEALLADKGKFQAVLNADNILDKNLGLDFTYDQGPYQVGFNADMEGNKNLGLSYNKGNLSAYANTDFNDPSVGFKYSKAFAYGGLASIL